MNLIIGRELSLLPSNLEKTSFTNPSQLKTHTSLFLSFHHNLKHTQVSF